MELSSIPRRIRAKIRNSIIYRVAEFYLMYAEVLNELGQGEEAIKWIDKVRERAGVPTYEHMIGNTQVKDGGTFQLSTKEAIREAIQRETFVELYCEGQWFFNARRWLDSLLRLLWLAAGKPEFFSKKKQE